MERVPTSSSSDSGSDGEAPPDLHAFHTAFVQALMSNDEIAVEDVLVRHRADLGVLLGCGVSTAMARLVASKRKGKDADDGDLDPELCRGDASRYTVLHLAAKYGTASFVRSAMATVRGCGHGARLAHYLGSGTAKPPLLSAAEANAVEVLRELLAAGADPLERSKKGRNALHHAAWAGRPETVAYLIDECGLDPNAEGNHWYPLHYASDKGRTAAARVLLERGAVVDKPSTTKARHPLHHAAWQGHADTVRLLIERGHADPNAHGNGWSPLHYACEKGHGEAARVLLDHGADPLAVTTTKTERGAVHLAAWSGHAHCVGLLLDRTANKTVDSLGNLWAPAHYAADKGHIDTLRLLKARGADLRILTEKTGRSALHIAAWNGHLSVVQYLTGPEVGIDPEAKGNGWTPLHYATDRGHRAIARYLVEECGVDVDARTDQQRNAALHLAVKNGHTVTLRWLLEHARADANATNSLGLTVDRLLGSFGSNRHRDPLAAEAVRHCMLPPQVPHACRVGRVRNAEAPHLPSADQLRVLCGGLVETVRNRPSAAHVLMAELFATHRAAVAADLLAERSIAAASVTTEGHGAVDAAWLAAIGAPQPAVLNGLLGRAAILLAHSLRVLLRDRVLCTPMRLRLPCGSFGLTALTASLDAVVAAAVAGKPIVQTPDDGPASVLPAVMDPMDAPLRPLGPADIPTVLTPPDGDENPEDVIAAIDVDAEHGVCAEAEATLVARERAAAAGECAPVLIGPLYEAVAHGHADYILSHRVVPQLVRRFVVLSFLPLSLPLALAAGATGGRTAYVATVWASVVACAQALGAQQAAEKAADAATDAAPEESQELQEGHGE